MSHIVSEKPYMRFALRKRSLGYFQARYTGTQYYAVYHVCTGSNKYGQGRVQYTYYSTTGGIVALGRLLYLYRSETDNRTQIVWQTDV